MSDESRMPSHSEELVREKFLAEIDAESAIKRRERLEKNRDEWKAEQETSKASKAFYEDQVRQTNSLRSQLAALQNAIPQTWGEVCQKVGTTLPCEPHEWDNRTTPENAAWALVTVADLAAQLAAREQEIEHLKAVPDNDSWRALVCYVYQIPLSGTGMDGARHIQSITSHYNAVRDERDRLQAALDEAKKIINKLELEIAKRHE